MPKTYSISKKQEWLAQMAQGKSPKQIASEAKCDERTIKRAVQEIRSKSAAQEALTQLYQEALRNHMDRLNAALDMIIEELRLPEPYLTETTWSQIGPSQSLSQYDKEDGEEEAKVPGGGDNTFSDSALLAEHLRHGKAWRALADWHRSYKKHRIACGRLQIKTLTVLSEKTGIKVRSKGDVTSTPFLHAENTGDLLCRTVIRYLLTKEDTSNLEKEIVADKEGGAVRHRTTVLAEGFEDAQQASQCKNNINKSLKILKESPEAQQVLNTFQQLEKNLPKARNELRAIRLLGVVPGQCRICRQFGL